MLETIAAASETATALFVITGLILGPLWAYVFAALVAACLQDE